MLVAGPVLLCYGAAAAPSQKQLDKHLKPGFPDISELSPQLQQEWHPDNNALLGDIKVKPHSSKRVLWLCPNCPAGCPHTWPAVIDSRTRGRQCPYFRGRKLCQHNSLATQAPAAARYWNHTNAKTPEQTLAGSKQKAAWTCPECKYEWTAIIGNRVRYGSGCPRCSRIGQESSKQPTFEQHALLSQWDHERNSVNGIYPYNTTLGSNKLVHWVCRKCPKGQLHRYRMCPSQRTRRRARGCSVCAGRQVCVCNSLEACNPTIAAEWDSAKNDISAADVTSSSAKVVWWKNARRGSWKDSINVRTDPRSSAT